MIGLALQIALSIVIVGTPTGFLFAWALNIVAAHRDRHALLAIRAEPE